MKEYLKKIVPASVWASIRKSLIVKDQRRVAKLCDSYIEEYYSGACGQYQWRRKKDLGGKKIIWQYWAQGFDSENLPQIVQDCLASVDKYKGDCEVIRLSDETISEYVDLPQIILERKKTYTTTSFSNVLRLALLYLYGGCWLDSTVYLTGPIDDRYFTYDFFMFQRDPSEENKRYWEGTYAFYFGWDKSFRVRVLTSIAFSRPESLFTRDYLNLLILVWEKNPVYPFYFTFQVLFNQLLASGKNNPRCPIESDCAPHILMQIINDPAAPFIVKEALDRCNMHKLSFKNMDYARFLAVIKEANECFSIN
ncbi:MAG: capsular polysaccharide synthesis protein [Bacteroidales bacterium]|nr:capsular polysaccharide synthesis protein [Bacteroidales bacterium]